jgi:hypothetical protein
MCAKSSRARAVARADLPGNHLTRIQAHPQPQLDTVRAPDMGLLTAEGASGSKRWKICPAVIELVAQEKANKQPDVGVIYSWRIHSEGLAPQNYSGSIRHSDENGWLPPAPWTVVAGRASRQILVGRRRDSGRPGSMASRRRRDAAVSLDSVATVRPSHETEIYTSLAT